MSTMLPSILAHLKAMVAIDTQNQSGNADATALFDYVQQCLTGFNTQQAGHAAQGNLTLHVCRGQPKILVNIHVDTVPAGNQWTSNPLELQITADRAIGLGACDIKGALACWLAAMEQSQPDQAALLLCSDEESGGSRGIREFLAQPQHYELALIAEPTQCKAITAHRGYASAKLAFYSEAGHSSAARALHDNTIHQASHFLVQAQELAQRYGQQKHHLHPSLSGICLNAGRIEGGLKNNIIAEHTELSFGCRPLPGQSALGLLEQLKTLPAGQTITHWETLAADPALPADENAPNADPIIKSWGLPIGEPVSFWTEAALFSASGIAAAVYGPGNIAQAHTSDEWVALEQLEQVANNYLRLLNGAL